MAVAGALTQGERKLETGTAGGIEYWRLMGGRRESGKRSDPMGGRQPVAVDVHLPKALARVEALVSHYLLSRNPFRPKLRPEWAWGDYDHLARVAEWINRRERGA